MIQYSLEDPSSSESDLDIDTHTGAPLLDLETDGSEKGLVGNFLHYTTQRAENFYEFKKGNQETYAGNRGEPLQDQDSFLVGGTDPGGLPFVPQGTRKDSLMDSYSNSRYFDDPTTDKDELITRVIDKVNGNVPIDVKTTGGRNANELIGGVRDESDYLVRHTIRSFRKNNRFNMDDTFPNSAPDISIDENRFAFVKEDRDFESSFEKLKDAAASQLLKASGYMTNLSPESGLKTKITELEILDDIAGPAKESSVNMPSNVEGLEVPKISSEKLLGMNATGVPKEGDLSVRSGTGVDIPYEEGSSNAGSFGVTYNQAIRFEDLTPTHKTKTALRMIVLYKLIENLYKGIVEELVKEDIEIIKDDILNLAGNPLTAKAGALALGSSRKSKKFVANNYLFNSFLTPTDFSYSECFYRGIEVIFGEDTENSKKVSKNLDKIYESPGFWLAIANTAIKKTFRFSDMISRLDSNGSSGSGQKEAIRSIINEFGSVAKIANIFAIIGEKSLHFTNGSNPSDPQKRVTNVRNVDQLEDIPGNRVGKSRKKNNSSAGGIGSETTLAWEQSDVPSAYLLPMNIIRAASDLNNTYTGVNPLRGLAGSRLVRNTYTGLDTEGTNARIPPNIVKILENRLDSEYVPFYMQDLRTNEIISFHAFLSQLTDSIQPNFSATQGYGRIDPVQGYQSTSRSIQVGFTLFATNREDFDDMWYKINKFVTLMYPQWTQGTIVQTGDPEDSGGFFSGAGGAKFVQPFTQTIGATPIVRLRIGDVIKSNYSRFALARTFGIGDQGVAAQPVGEKAGNIITGITDGMRKYRDVALAIFGALVGSPQGLIKMGADALTEGTAVKEVLVAKAAINAAEEAGATLLAEVLINGFVSPLLAQQTISRLKDPNTFGGDGFAGTGSSTMFVYINPNMIDGYQCVDGDRYFTTKRLTGIVKGLVNDETGNQKIYKVKVNDFSDDRINGKVLLVKHENIWNDPAETFSKSVAGLVYAVAGADFASVFDALLGIKSKKGGLGAIGTDFAAEAAALLFENPESAFMRPEANPFTRGFHSTRGRGLAGVVKGVTFNWLDDFAWETDHNARAPMGCNIQFTFDVIHDIPPGLDHTGFNKAPLYNVGEVMRNVAGDVYEDRFSKSERKFREGGSSSIKPGNTATKIGKK